MGLGAEAGRFVSYDRVFLGYQECLVNVQTGHHNMCDPLLYAKLCVCQGDTSAMASTTRLDGNPDHVEDDCFVLSILRMKMLIYYFLS